MSPIASPRFEGTRRVHSAREVIEQRGTIRPDYTVARSAAEAFYARLRQLAELSSAVMTDAGPVDVDAVTALASRVTADPRTHTVQARVYLPDNQPGIIPGMFARAHFVTGKAKKLLVPAAAVLRRGEVTAVYVIDDKNAARLRQLRLSEPLAGGFQVGDQFTHEASAVAVRESDVGAVGHVRFCAHTVWPCSSKICPALMPASLHGIRSGRRTSKPCCASPCRASSVSTRF